jgi:hypothetical protein
LACSKTRFRTPDHVRVATRRLSDNVRHHRGVLRLKELVADVESLSDDYTIYAADASPTAPAVAAPEPEGGGVPPEAAGLSYFLEVALAKESIRVWSEWRHDAEPTLDDKIAAVIHDAKTDSYLPVEEDPRSRGAERPRERGYVRDRCERG